MLLSLKEHQIKTVEYGVRNPYSIFALGMRTGKSVVTLDLHEKLKQKTLIVCPAYLINNWENEIYKCLGHKTKVTLIRNGPQIPKVDLDKSDLIVISYTLATKAERLFKWADTVALDEAHHIKSMEAKRTQAIHQYVYENSIKNLYCLTGTPIRNRVADFYSLICLMNYNPRIKESQFLKKYPNFIEFADRFSHKHTYYIQIGFREIPITKWSGLKNKEELKIHLKNCYIRFHTEDVIPGGSVEYANILLSKEDDLRLLEDFSKYFDDENSSVKSEFKKLAAIEKTKLTIKYIEDSLDEMGQVVVYSDHVEPARIIAKHFGTTAISGEVPMGIRNRIKDDFTSGRTKVIVATIKSFSEGVDLSVASHMVFNDFPWVPGELNQAEMRVQGYNQKRPVTIHRILGSPQDEYILEAIQEKIETITKVV